MKTLRKVVTAIALMAILTVTTLMAGIQLTAAHTPPWQIPTYAYITAQPNPVGVGQQAFLVFWLDLPPPTAAGVGGDRWKGFTIKVTRPDGTTESLGPYTSDPTGGTYALYTPQQVGVYKFDVHFPGQVAALNNPDTGVPGSPSVYVNDTFLPSDASATLTVQQESIQKIPASPLPTEYWTRPINQENSNWASVASNWLGLFQTYRVQDDGLAPNSAHVMWTMPIEFGGIVGGNSNNEAGYYTGMSYEIRFGDALILQGRLYFTMPLHDDPSAGPYTCVDLATGTILWQRQGIRPTFASLYDYESPNQHGVIPSGALYQAVGTTWIAYDAFTGAWAYNLTNVPSGTQVLQKDGTIARYVLNYNTTRRSGWLAKWTTAALPNGPLVLTPGTTTDAYQYRPVGKNADMRNNYEWNVTITADLTGSTAPAIVAVLPDDIILGRSSNIGITSVWRGTEDPWAMWTISDKSSNRGSLVWKQSYPAPPGNISQMLTYMPIDKVNRVITMTYFETGERLGYNLDTGQKMWGPVGTPYQVDHAFQYFSSRAGQNAYGELIVGGYGGEVFAYDTKTGNKLWNFNDTNHGVESNWGMIPTFPSMMADGKVFAIGGEHSPNVPLYKNERLYAIDAFTGKELWNLTAWSSSGLGEAAANMYVADGYLVFYNCYDSQLYCIGKGPSETTVSAPQTAANVGSSVMITGSVTDQSPGAEGKAAISDEWMTKWMEYLYEQQPIPGNAEGVTVKLTAIDPNGNTQDIGQVTTDLKGNFGKMWKPPVPGQYTIIASFEGSNSYWPSYSTAYLAVDPAAPSPSATVPPPTSTPTLTPPPTTPTPPPTTASPSPTQAPPPAEPSNTALYVAVAAVVIVAVVVASAVVLKRRK
ncbi:MAG: PQQ-binding-like beta-propeller repeat protein [Candidatus Bathyarchaeia archaeon]